MLLAVETAMETLSEAGNRNVPRDQMIEQFRKMADSVWRWYVPPEKQVGRELYRSIIDKTGSGCASWITLPPSAFVAEQVTALNRERGALLASQPWPGDCDVVMNPLFPEVALRLAIQC